MITKDNNLKVMALFFKAPYSRFHIRAIARRTSLSSTGVIKIIHRLKEEKLLVSRRVNNIEEVRPDFDGRFLFMKRLYNLYSLYETGLIKHLLSYYERPKTIILFGSYADGTDTEKSDIDIAVYTSKQSPQLANYEELLARRISIHNISGKSSKEFINSLANGIVLHGFMELAK